MLCGTSGVLKMPKLFRILSYSDILTETGKVFLSCNLYLIEFTTCYWISFNTKYNIPI